MYCIKHKGNCTKEAYILHENICMPYISAHMCSLLHSCSNSGWDAGWDAVADAGCSGCGMWLMREAVADAGCSGAVHSGTGCCGWDMYGVILIEMLHTNISNSVGGKLEVLPG